MRPVKLTIRYFDNIKKVSLSTDDVSTCKIYNSGELLINYIELDFDKLLDKAQSIEESFFHIIPENEIVFKNSIEKVNVFLSELAEIHPYNSDYANIFDEYIRDNLKSKLNISECLKLLELFVHELGQQIYFDREIAQAYRKVISKCYDKKELKNGLSPYQIYSKAQMSFWEIGSINVNKTYFAPLEENPKAKVKFEEISNDININTACFLELQKLLEERINVTKCTNCLKFFINTGSKNIQLCNRKMNSSNQTCKDVGAKNNYKKKIKNLSLIHI